MAVDELAAPAGDTYCWQVTVEDPERTPAVRDYFRRLGFEAVVHEPGVVRVPPELEAEEIEEYVGSWVDVNREWLAVDWVDTRPPLLLPPPPQTTTPRLGTLLVQKGFISEQRLASALMEARASGELLGIVLLREQSIFEDELARTLSEQLDIPYLSIMHLGVNPTVARLLPYDVGMQAAAIPVRQLNGVVQVVFADPTDPAAVEAVREYIPHFDVAVGELTDIKMAWRQFGRGVA